MPTRAIAQDRNGQAYVLASWVLSEPSQRLGLGHAAPLASTSAGSMTRSTMIAAPSTSGGQAIPASGQAIPASGQARLTPEQVDGFQQGEQPWGLVPAGAGDVPLELDEGGGEGDAHAFDDFRPRRAGPDAGNQAAAR